MSTISKALPTPPDNFSTQIASSSIGTTTLSIQLDDATDLGTEGVGQLFKKDANGDIIAGSIEFIHWTGKSSNTITLTDTGDRGIAGSDSGAQSYVADDYFEVWVSSYYDGTDAFLVEHNADGTHKETALDSIITGTEASGDIIYHNGTIWTRLAKGSDGQVLSLSSGLPSWSTSSGGDWTAYSTVTPTTGTLDSPSFPIVFAGVDLSTTLYPGMRVKITQSTTKYFIITKVSYSTDTTVTLYGGTDYSLVASGTTAISAFSYSTAKAPSGFPLDPAVWTQTLTDTSDRTQSTPTNGTWYNPGSLSLAIPIGVWSVEVNGQLYASKAGTNTLDAFLTLSTANNSESDTGFTTRILTAAVSDIILNVFKKKSLTLTAKTTYYVNVKSAQSSITTVGLLNSSTPLFVRCISAYL